LPVDNSVSVQFALLAVTHATNPSLLPYDPGAGECLDDWSFIQTVTPQLLSEALKFPNKALREVALRHYSYIKPSDRQEHFVFANL
jgi:hypothetical protein